MCAVPKRAIPRRQPSPSAGDLTTKLCSEKTRQRYHVCWIQLYKSAIHGVNVNFLCLTTQLYMNDLKVYSRSIKNNPGTIDTIQWASTAINMELGLQNAPLYY